MWGKDVDVSDIEQTIWTRMAAITERLWSPQNEKSALHTLVHVSNGKMTAHGDI